MVALLAAATSCDKYDIYPEQYGKVLMIKDAGEKNVTIYATEETAPYYVSVMKNGHTPEDPAQATLKILDETEFGAYKEKYYGRKDFEGLQILKEEYYYLADIDTVKTEDNLVGHTFQTEDDRYFGALVVFNAQAISDWRLDLETRAKTTNKNETERQLALDTLNKYTFVVPVGLFSSNDSVNTDNQYLMLTPVVENPVIGVSVSNDAAMIVDQNRAYLKDENSEYRKGSFGEELVKFTLPCPNPYGFRVKFNNNATTDIARFNGHHTDMVLTELKRKNDNGTNNFDLASNKIVDYIEFPKGKTEVWLPITFFRSNMDYNDMEHNFATSIQLAGFDWKAYQKDDGTKYVEVPKKVQNSLKLPQSELTWTPKNAGDDGKYDGYTFFVGYRVVEQPLDLDGGCIIGANDPETTEGSFEALFDDDLSTFYHSAWSDEARKDRTSQYGSYLDFEIPTKEPINAVAFKFTARVHAAPHGPKIVKLFYSNAKTEAERDATWEPILRAGIPEITVKPNPGKDNSGSGQVTWLGDIKTDDGWIKAKEPFRYLRMCVIQNSYDEKLTSIGTKGAGYWNLAELRLYGTVLN